MSIFVTSLCVAFAAVLLLLANNLRQRHRNSLPPGPKGLPYIGTPSELPSDYTWLHIAKHKDIYGPISSVTVFGNTYVILNDVEVADELLNKRSLIYSERQRYIVGEMSGMSNVLTLLGTGPTLKAHRTAVQQSFGSNDFILRLAPLVEAEARRVLAHSLTSPGELETCLKSFAAAVLLKATYGYSMDTKHPDPLAEEVEESNRVFMLIVQPAAWLVDAVPLLRYLPTWMPGSGFKAIARVWRKQLLETVERPYLFAKQKMAAGTVHHSHISNLFEQAEDTPDQYMESVFKWSASTVYAAGSNTSVSLLHSFFLAMILYPEVQKKAQKEIDEVIGSDRLPTSSDRDSLPYVIAVTKEVLRWHTSVPLGIPHVTKEDDVYSGYFIPKGSTVLPNIWLFSHDPSNYHDPFTFKPERFLSVNGSKTELDPSTTIFGFGRRICPGKKFAESLLFHMIAISLATLVIGKAHDADGVEITPVHETTMACHPKSFECSITARSKKAQDLIVPEHKDDGVAPNDAETIQAISLKF